MPFLAKDSFFARLAQIADVSTLSKEESRKYDHSIKQYRDALATHEYSWMQGKAAGVAEGEARGEAKMLRAFISSGMTKEQVAATLHMSISDVRSLLAAYPAQAGEA